MTDELIHIVPMEDKIKEQISKSLNGYVDIEMEEKIKGGSKISIHFIAQHLKDSNGNIIGTIGIGKDITHEKSMEAALMKAEQLATVGTLATGIAHQIRGPLNGIKGSCEFFKHKKVFNLEDESIKINVEAVDVNIKHISDTTEAFMELARGFNSPPKSVSIKDLIDKSLLITKDDLSSVTVHKERIPENLRVFVEESSIKNVFINLLQNAAESISKNGEITISAIEADSYVCVKISDNGPGIPKEKQSLVFKELIKSEKKDGTGMGLLLCYKFVCANKGLIEFTSEENIGTVFSIKLPLQKGEET